MRTFIRFAFECVWCMHDDNDTCVIICAWFKACTPAVPIPTIVNWRWRFVMLNVKQMTTPFQNHLLFNYFFDFFLGYCYCWFPSFFHVWYLVIYILLNGILIHHLSDLQVTVGKLAMDNCLVLYYWGWGWSLDFVQGNFAGHQDTVSWFPPISRIVW